LTKLILSILLEAVVAAAQSSVTTYHNDNARTGRYASETLLAPANVKAGLFGKRSFLLVDGAVYAQPLYLSRVKISAKGFRNLLVVATAHDSVYAFDADDSSAPPLWHVNFLDASRGVTTVSLSDVNCAVIPELGITGTPVIDPNSGTIYAIALTKEPGGQYVYRLHALDIRSGAERPGSPVKVQPPGFVPSSHKQRTALLLSKGMVYSSWSGHCDLGTYQGWVMAHDAATLKLLAAFNDTPDGSGASFWNGGAGPSADEEGNIFVVSANGDFDGDASEAQFDESVLKLAPAPQLSVTGLFTPFNKAVLDQLDLDLGSSGALVLPDEAGSAAHSHLLFTSGKEGRMYLLDRDGLGGVQAGSDSRAVASLPALNSHPTFGMAAYFNGAIYISPANSPLLAFPLAGASLSASPSAQTANIDANWGATPSISANGVENGIVWIIDVANAAKLLAYDAKDLSLLYDSDAQPADALPTYSEFSVPTIADGKVFAGTYYGVAVYGEIAADAPSIAAVTNAASYSSDAIAQGSLVSLFGAHLAPATARASGTPLPLSLADTSVTVNGVVAPLLFVSPQQINAQIPSEIGAGPATVVVRVMGTVSAPVTITVRVASPGVFTDGQGQAALLNADGSVNSPQNPAASGSIVSAFFTGQGPVSAVVEDGAAPPAGQEISATSTISATIGSLPAEITFAGLAPLYPGVAQMNLKIPALTSGVHSLIINISGAASNAAQLVISGP
jgi:uncharacterized protein (TIGR03437 family)